MLGRSLRQRVHAIDRDVHPDIRWRDPHMRAGRRRQCVLLGIQRQRAGFPTSRHFHRGFRRRFPHLRTASRRQCILLGRQFLRASRSPRRHLHSDFRWLGPHLRVARRQHCCLLGQKRIWAGHFPGRHPHADFRRRGSNLRTASRWERHLLGKLGRTRLVSGNDRGTRLQGRGSPGCPSGMQGGQYSSVYLFQVAHCHPCSAMRSDFCANPQLHWPPSTKAGEVHAPGRGRSQQDAP